MLGLFVGAGRRAGGIGFEMSDVLVAFYTVARSAQAAAPHVIDKAKRFRGEFERAGANNVVWITAPPHRLLDIVDRCVAGYAYSRRSGPTLPRTAACRYATTREGVRLSV
jgi:hypothetical protein